MYIPTLKRAIAAANVIAMVLFSSTALAQFDFDADGVEDDLDNCQMVANVSQLDGDADGFGNACDADLNNDCIVNAVDLGLFRSVFFSADPTADFNGDGVVNATDLGLLRLQFFEPPGPSGQPNHCATHSTITIITRTGAGTNHDSDSSFEFCVSAAACWTLNDANINERETGQIDHLTLATGAVTIADFEALTLRPTAGSGQDAWLPQCLTVLLGDDLLYCNDGQNGLGDNFIGSESGSNEIPAYTDNNVRRQNCQSCYASALTHGPMVGHTTTQSSRIWLRTSYALPVQVRYSRQIDFVDSVTTDSVSAEQSDDFATIVDLTDLQAGTLYYYEVLLNGVAVSEPGLNFVTAPNQPTPFRAAFGSCMRPSNTDFATLPIFNDLAQSAPDLLLMLGDNHYADSAVTSRLNFFYRNTRRIESFANVLARTPTWAVWDDHDFTGNNNDGSSPDKENSLAAFKRFWANADYGSGGIDGIWSAFSYGDVDFFLLDDRYYRDQACTNTGSEPSSASMLGAEQRDWLIDQLTASTATFKVIVSGSQWNEAGGSLDSWACFSSERDTILDEVMHAGIDGVVLLSGDVHRQEVWRVRDASADSYELWELTSSSFGFNNGSCPPGEDPVFCASRAESYAIIDFDTTATPPRLDFEARDIGNTLLHSVSLELTDLCDFCEPRLPRDQVWHQDRYGVRGGVEPGDQFGAALASADFDNDGIDDLAIGIPFEDIDNNSIANAGAVQVLYGSPRRLSNRDDFWTEQNLPASDGAEDDVLLGSSLTAADFDGDGFGDLAMGLPGERVSGQLGAGQVQVLYGSDGGLDAQTSQVFDQTMLAGSPEPDDRFGLMLTNGDFNGDGFDDLIVGTPEEHIGEISDAGFVQFIPGSADGLTAVGTMSWHQGTAGMAGNGNQAEDLLGGVFAVGDFNADGFDDLAAGLAQDDIDGVVDTGSVIVFYGAATGLSAQNTEYWHQNTPGVVGVNSNADQFGAALAAGDFDGDGFVDLAIGQPGENGVNDETSSGALTILNGSADGLTAVGSLRLDQDSPGAAGGAESGDFFGATLQALDLNQDGILDLAVGVPGEAVSSNTIEDSGAVQVFFGTNEGLQATSPNDRFWHQSADGFRGAAAQGDEFGTVLHSGDFDGDGVDDLAVGVPQKDVSGDDQAGAMVLIYGESDGAARPSTDTVVQRDIRKRPLP